MAYLFEYHHPPEQLYGLWDRIKDSYKFPAIGLECGMSNHRLLEDKLSRKIWKKDRLIVENDLSKVIEYLSDPLVDIQQSYPCCVKERNEAALTISHKYAGKTHLLIVPGVIGVKPPRAHTTSD